MKLFDLKSQYKKIDKNINRSINKVLLKNNFILGEEVSKLELKLSQISSSKFCTTCGNGTDGLLISLMALNLNKNDEVMIPSFNYISALEVTVLLNLKPIFIDVDDDYNISVKDIEKKITKNTKCIIATSLFGRCCNYESLLSIRRKFKLKIIEDGSQSFGSSRHDYNSCSVFDLSVTSFFPTKPLGCYVDGGAIFTNNKNYYKKIKLISRHGQKSNFNHISVGLNSRLDTIQASILLEKIKIFKKELEMRDSLYISIKKILVKHSWLKFQLYSDYERPVHAIFPLRITNTFKRNKLIYLLKKNNIEIKKYYPKPIYRQRAYREFFKKKNPNAEKLCKETISIPFNPYLKNNYIKKIKKILEEI